MKVKDTAERTQMESTRKISRKWIVVGAAAVIGVGGGGGRGGAGRRGAAGGRAAARTRVLLPSQQALQACKHVVAVLRLAEPAATAPCRALPERLAEGDRGLPVQVREV
jgi:hypothetical protein